MVTITIDDGRGADWLYGKDEEWKDFVCPDFDEKVVLTGNDRMTTYEDASWWKDAKEVITDLDSYLEAPEFREEYANKYSSDQIEAVISAYDAWNGDHYVDFITKIAQILHPEIKLEETTLRGYSQSDWQDAIYVSGSLDENILEAYYFNMLTELHYEDDSGEDYWDTITDDELWKMERGDLKQNLREHFGIPADEEIKIRKFSGYSQTPNYDEL